MGTEWFRVDKDGLARLLEKRGKAFAIYELVQNCWDTGAKQVGIILEKEGGRPIAKLTVEDDDPDGFKDLTHAYTLFADSEKKDDPERRGRFNLGEKLVLALCKRAEITSTTGTIIFDADGQRRRSQRKSESGSRFWAEIRMTQPEYEEVCEAVHRLIPPAGVETTFNGETIEAKAPVATFEAVLQTVRADSEGNLIRTQRKTTVGIHEPGVAEPGWIYEMGIPVVQTGDRYNINVAQKVPVNLDRDNVPPAYLRKIRALALNETFGMLSRDEAAETWVTHALDDKEVTAAAVTGVLTDRFGEKRAVFDPSDREANNRLMGEGYTIIAGRTFGKTAWANIRDAGAAKPSGKISPTAKPYGEDGEEVEEVPSNKWTPGMAATVDMIERVGLTLIDREVRTRIVMPPIGTSWAATYDTGVMTLNLRKLGRKWFDPEHRAADILDLTIHELGHEFESNHLSARYLDALSRLAGKAILIALRTPDVYSEARRKE